MDPSLTREQRMKDLQIAVALVATDLTALRSATDSGRRQHPPMGSDP
jgi:hypothetical protein